MIAVAVAEVEALQLGLLLGARSGATFTGVKADSRDVGPGDLFVAINTGTSYVDDALAAGAAALVPVDQDAALAGLATLVRSKSDARIVSVVGSVGKTTTKDILGALCAPHVPTVWAERSMNNEIGLPLTVCRLEPDTRVLIAEMGMRGLGEIAALCAIAQPEVVVVSHIGPEHLETLETVERVAQAYAEAIAALPPGGTVVAPAGPTELEPFLRDDLVVRRFDPAEIEVAGTATRFRLDARVVELELSFGQRHLLGNTLAALHAYASLGLPLDRVAEGAKDIVLSPWRGQETLLPGGGLVVNDAYNANPDSMRAALQHLARRAPDRHRLAILGEMAELGRASQHYHEEIGALSRELAIDVIGVGDHARAYDPLVLVATPEEAVRAARDVMRPGDAVLVKASRAVGLEGIADEIANMAAALFEDEKQ